MANASAPFGLRPAKSLGGVNTQINEYAHPSTDGTALFIGDPVTTIALGGSSASSSLVPDGTPYVIASGTITTTRIRGAVASVRPTLTNLTLQYCAASTELGILVYDDPFQLFDVMVDAAATLVIDDISDTMGITAVAGSTVTGLSKYTATQSTGHADNAYVLQVIRMTPTINNLLGLNSIIRVRVALHELNTISAPG